MMVNIDAVSTRSHSGRGAAGHDGSSASSHKASQEASARGGVIGAKAGSLCIHATIFAVIWVSRYPVNPNAMHLGDSQNSTIFFTLWSLR
jgi:hypothetical protein